MRRSTRRSAVRTSVLSAASMRRSAPTAIACAARSPSLPRLICVIGNFIFGLPDDDVQTMQQTLDLALELNCEFANFYSAMAYPGSPLYLMAVQNGWELPAAWSGYSQHSYDCLPLRTEKISAGEV